MKDEYTKISKEYLIGYLAGIIQGISWRQDVPTSVRRICEKAYLKYEVFYEKLAKKENE